MISRRGLARLLRRTPRIALFVAVVVAALSLMPLPAARAQSNVVGEWGPTMSWPGVAVFTHVLPNGKVMWFPYYDTTFIWDPETGTTTPGASFGYNPFCGALSFTKDGNLLHTGGQGGNGGDNGLGENKAAIYNSFTDTVTPLPNMNNNRWYPTNITMPDGEIVVMAGTIDTNFIVNLMPQAWDGTQWRNLTNALRDTSLYPYLHIAPNGLIFMTGPQRTTRYLDPAGTGQWTTVADRKFSNRNYGGSVMYDDGKVVMFGGGIPPTASVEVIDLNAPTPVWRYTQSMPQQRRQINSTLLPSGKILITGGVYGTGFNNRDTPIYSALLWDPVTESFTTLASMPTPRWYHSTAVLLPDGRVLSAGGDSNPTAEVYSPPYLFQGPRPTITNAPSVVAYGQTFAVESPEAANITNVNWIRLSSVTHSNNMSQRIKRLPFTQSGNLLTAQAPADPNQCPPGYYMMFVLINDVPSIAHMVQIVDIDITPPSIFLVSSIAESTRVIINFDEAMDPTTAGDTANYQISGGITVTAAVPGPAETVTLTTSQMTPGVQYTLTVNNVEDANGVVILPNTQETFEFVPDTAAPVIETVLSVADPTLVTITFNEALEPNSANELSNYAISPGVTIISLSLVDDRTVALTTTTVDGGLTYTLAVQGIADLYGNVIPAGTVADFMHFSPQVGLTAYWPLDEGVGNANDLSGNGYTGILKGPSWVAGPFLSFDGADDYVDAGTFDLNGTAMTMATWFFSDNLANCGSNDCRLIAKATDVLGPDHYWMMSTIAVGADTRLRFRLKTDGFTSTLIATDGNLDANRWYHAAAVYDGAEMRLYLDGVLVGSTPKQGQISVDPAVPVWLGGTPPAGNVRPWAGMLSDVRLYERVLAVEEILGLFSDNPEGNPPVADDIMVTVDEDGSVPIVLTGSDPENLPITFGIETDPSNGTLTGTPPNLIYTPAPDYFGSDSFTFSVSDVSQQFDVGTVSITVTPINDPPVAQSIAISTTVDTPVDFTLLATDTEADLFGGILDWVIQTPPTSGAVTGTLPSATYTPDPGFAGQDSFTFTADDNIDVSNEATVTITVDQDCNANGVADATDIANGTSLDCQGNNIADECELDCNANGVPDDCDLTAGTSPDCNSNGIPDECDIAAGTSLDCNSNGVPDTCDPDCNSNNIPDDCDVAGGAADCNLNSTPDSCDIASGTSLDSNNNNIPDECETDCNSNGIGDAFDIAVGTSLDCNNNLIPDECDLTSGTSLDCNGNTVPDECDIAGGASQDCNSNSIPDSCELLAGTSLDCDFNNVPDECQPDCDSNGVIDACEAPLDCNNNGQHDTCDILSGGSNDGNNNGIPDECEGGLRAYWPFDEGSGLTTADSTGNGSDGTLQQPTWSGITTDGSPFSLRFDGVDDRVALGNLDIPGQTLTLAVRFRIDDFGVVDGRLLSKAFGIQEPEHYWMLSTIPSEGQQRLRFRLRAGGITTTLIATAGNLFAGVWYHAAAVYDGATMKLYLNGAEVGSTPKIGSIDVNPGVGAAIGNQPAAAGPRAFDGFIDDVRIYDLALSATAVSDLANQTFVDCNGNGNPDTDDLQLGTSPDCNANGIPDECDLAAGTSPDVNANGTPDECEIDCNSNGVPDPTDVSAGTSQDCNSNGIPDECDITAGTSLDCNTDGTPDECQTDCNNNGIPDDCDITSGTAADCDNNNVPDSCDVAASDCNNNGVPDSCDVSAGTSQDCNTNNVPDECEPDCNNNGAPDDCDVTAGTSPDCNSNGIPDECDIASGVSTDCNSDGIPDSCQVDCNGNGVHDSCDIAAGTSQDCNNNGVPDECDVLSAASLDCNNNGIPDECDLGGLSLDCNVNGIPDECDIAAGTSSDCNGNSVPDSCDLAAATSLDCNTNNVPDECDIAAGTSTDCNGNSVPDSCDLAIGTSLDCNSNSTPDECDIAANVSADCNTNGIPDECDVNSGASDDCDTNGVPDECQPDCNSNGIPDTCDVANGTGADCNNNGTLDSCDVAAGTSLDCNSNNIPDECDIAAGTSQDCNSNSVPDSCEPDCNTNGSPDDCDVANGATDCNLNGNPDDCDIASGSSQDTNNNNVPDECEGFLGHWPFDEGTGTIAADISPSGADGTLNLRQWSSDTNDGSPFSLDFDGVDDRVDVGVLNVTGNTMSIAAWVRIDDFDVMDARIISKAVDVFDQDHFWMLSTLRVGVDFRLRFRLKAGGDTTTLIATSGNLTTNEWTHVAAVYDGAEMRLYKDGVLVGAVPKTGVVDQAPVPVTIGNQSPGAGFRPFDGALDDVRVYERALSEAELVQLSQGFFLDCNGNFIDDAVDLSSGASQDCNGNGVPDECDLGTTSADCNSNGTPDECEPDCDGNGVPDDCDIAAGALDCNSNGAIDSCEITAGTALDCNGNTIPDSCDIAAGAPDCNSNGAIDSCEISAGTALDCNGNTIPDSCDIAAGTPDCNGNGVPDACDITAGTAIDCNGNAIPDSCDIAAGTPDCNVNGVPDSCDITAGTSLDCDGNGIPDSCDLTTGQDCNNNGVLDSCDIAGGTSSDGNNNQIPDECETDCNLNGVFDPLDISSGTSQDCNNNGIPDECDLSAGTSQDCDLNNVPDECDPDCDGDGTPDSCAISSGSSLDCNVNGVPDECDLVFGTSNDCNVNGTPDECEVPALDCNANGVPDSCDIAAGTSQDCNTNNTPDECDISLGTSDDCDSNGVPDECEVANPDCNSNGTTDSCDIAAGTSQDCNSNGVPDECEVDCDNNGQPDDCDIAAGAPDCNSNGALDSCEADCDNDGVPDDCAITGGAADCNGNGVPDSCDIASGTSVDSDGNQVPDECEGALLGHWDFEDGPGAVAADQSGNGFNGTVTGAQFVADTTDGTAFAMRFDGVNDRVALPAIDVPGSAMSIAAWVRADDFEVFDARIMTKSTGAQEAEHFWMLSTIQVGPPPQFRPRFRLKTDGVTTTLIASSAAGNLQIGTWAHVAATYDGSFMRLFVNGVEVGIQAKTGSITADPTVPVAIGNQPVGVPDKTFDGVIDDVRLYATALNATEIAEIMTGNMAPNAQADTYDAVFETVLTVDANSGVLDNDNDPDLDGMTAVLQDDVDVGQLTLNSDGSFTYTPPQDFTGPASFTYQATDGALSSETTTVTINVQPDANAPTATPEGYSTITGNVLSVAAPGVLDNDTDPNSLTLSAVLDTPTSNGTLVLNGDGSFTYDPDSDFLGEDSFIYRATNGAQQSFPVTVTITVIVDPDKPVAAPDFYIVAQDGMLSVNSADGVIENDTDPNGDSLDAVLFQDVTDGGLTLNSDGSLTYVPDPGFFGVDTFRYRADDGVNLSTDVLVTIVVSANNADALLVPPPPGSIYKEFTRLMALDNIEWRVTDPLASNPGSPGNSPQTFLPNPVLDLAIDDLVGAVRAEAIMDVWGGHVGTIDKQLIVNGNAPITIPVIATTPTPGECYTHQATVVVDVPVSDLVTGPNFLEGDSGGQTCFNFNWGQWGWYGVTIRVYYDSSKPHPTGTITSPTPGSSFDEDPLVTADAQSSVGVDEVQFFAYYDGYDTDGDGVYLGYHYNRHVVRNAPNMDPRDHVGTDTTAPYALTWDTELVPDQQPSIIRLVARIRDNNGVYYVTPEVTGLTLARTLHEVFLAKPTNVPESFWVRAGDIDTSEFVLPLGSLTGIVSAKLLARTWNGIDGFTEIGETNYRLINGVTIPEFGENHYYQFDVVDVPTSALIEGTNTFTMNSTTIHHGIEMMWPGPAVLIRRTIPAGPPEAPGSSGGGPGGATGATSTPIGGDSTARLDRGATAPVVAWDLESLFGYGRGQTTSQPRYRAVSILGWQAHVGFDAWWHNGQLLVQSGKWVQRLAGGDATSPVAVPSTSQAPVDQSTAGYAGHEPRSAHALQ
ncbi:MAG: LamG-like jellyroll fold domain-containing protein [Planctomycetota bacterium]